MKTVFRLSPRPGLLENLISILRSTALERAILTLDDSGI
jgi:hypothetical protein